MAPSTASSAAFKKDEKVLCFHQELLYEANILEVKNENDDSRPTEYKVHYRGWKKTWDSWVPQDRLKKLTEENHKLARSLKEEMDSLRNQNKPAPKALATKKKGDSSARGSEERGFAAGKKRGRDFDVEKEEAYYNKPAVRIIIPDTLKSILVDDWENITKNYQLVHLPAKYSVNQILDDFWQHEKPKRPEHSAAVSILEEVIAGLREYFNKCLGRILLYRFERGQYEDILAQVNKPGNELEARPLADIYGAEHLLRLFTSMPELIAQTNMDQQSVAQLRKELNDFTLWMSRQENINKYLSSPYENQGTEYQERAGVHEKRKPPTPNLRKKTRASGNSRAKRSSRQASQFSIAGPTPNNRTTRAQKQQQAGRSAFEQTHAESASVKPSPVEQQSFEHSAVTTQLVEASPAESLQSTVTHGPEDEDTDDQWGKMIMAQARRSIAARRQSTGNGGTDGPDAAEG